MIEKLLFYYYVTFSKLKGSTNYIRVTAIQKHQVKMDRYSSRSPTNQANTQQDRLREASPFGRQRNHSSEPITTDQRSAAPRPRKYEVIKGTEDERSLTRCLYVGNLPYVYTAETGTYMPICNSLLK